MLSCYDVDPFSIFDGHDGDGQEDDFDEAFSTSKLFDDVDPAKTFP